MINFENIQCPPSGPTTARCVLVGEAPGEEEVVQRLPFVGASGQLLWKIMKELEMTRDKFYVTNVAKNHPPGNKLEKLDIPAFDQYWLSILQAELREVKPNVVVALGGTALNALCNYDENFQLIRKGKKQWLSVSKWRGSILPCTLVPGLKVLVTLHPASIIRQWGWRTLLMTDLARIEYQQEFPEIRQKSRTIYAFPSYNDAVDYMESVTDIYATDVEIRNNDLACFAIAPRPDEAMCIPIMKGKLENYWTPEEELGIFKRFAKLLQKEIPSIGQNYVFDLFWYFVYGCRPYMEIVYDTMLMQNLLAPEMDKDLATLCSIYTDHPYYKDDGKIWLANARISDEQFYKYNATDAIITRECCFSMLDDLRETKLYDFYHQRSMPLIKCVMKPMLKGLRVDLKRQYEVYTQYKEEISALTAKFRQLVGKPDFNPNSQQQLKHYLYTEQGVKEQRNKKTKKLTVDEATLEMFAAMYAAPELEVLLDIRGKTKTASTFINPNRNDSDGRSRCSYNIPGTDSGRMSSSKGPLGSGGNLQNITHGLCRSIYIPDDQMVWLECDQSQAEVRIVAHLAPEPRLIDLFNKGLDVHKFNAGIAFEIPYDQVTKPKRYVAKHLVHAADYDVQPKTFAMTMNKKCRDENIPLHMTIQQAEVALGKYHNHFTMIKLDPKSWHHTTQLRLLENNFTLVNILGRPHTFLDHYGPEMFRKAYNWQAQSVVADIENIGWIRFHERYPQWDVMMQIHDALIVQCRLFEVDRVKEALRECFDIQLEANGIKFKIPVEFKIATERWSIMKDA